MTVRTLLPALVALVLGIALGWLLRGEGSVPAARVQPIAVEQGGRDEAIAVRLSSIEAALHELRRELAGASNSRRVVEPETRETVSTNAIGTSAQPVPDPVVARVEEELKSLGERMEALRQAVAGGAIAAKFPTLEMIRRAQEEPNQAKLNQLVDDRSSRDGLLWMTQEEVLATLGRPSVIFKRGQWGYLVEGKEGWKVTLRFVDDYVAQVYVERSWQDF